MIPYILHAGVILACCLLFYKILLQKETFYQLNRFVLLGCLVLSFSLPLLPIPQQFSLRKLSLIKSEVTNSAEPVSSSGNTTVQQSQPAQVAPVNQVLTGRNISFHQVMGWLTWLYWFGAAAFSITFFIQVITLLYYRKKQLSIIYLLSITPGHLKYTIAFLLPFFIVYSSTKV